jgi:DNA-binding MarR family transcriptional regulator
VGSAVRHWAERYPESGSSGASGFRALTSLVRSYGVVIRAVDEVLRPLELTLSRYEVLLLLSFTRGASLPIMRLRELLMIHGSSVTYLVDRLEQAGWVARHPDPSDRRVSLVEITDSGLEVVDRASALLDANDFGLFGVIEDDRLELFSDLLAELRQEAEARAESAEAG